MLLTVVIFLLALVAAILIFAATKPDKFHVERTTSIAAAPEVIYPFINDLHHWAAWSPYEKLDPAMQKTHSGATSGAGAGYAWQGNPKVGAGSMKIKTSEPVSHVALDLDMFKPFKAHNDVAFRLQPNSGGTAVTWAMDGKHAFIPKVMSLFINMDKMIGGQFEEGLANLKAVAEKSS